MIDGIDNTPLDILVKQLTALPGLGRRSAKRIALHLLTHKDTQMFPLAKSLNYVAEIIQTCDSFLPRK